MKRLALLAAFSAPLCASAQVEKASEVRLVESPGAAPASLTAAPSVIALTAPSLTAVAAPSAAAPIALSAPVPAAAVHAAALPVAAVATPAAPLPLTHAAALPAPAAADQTVRDARGQLREGGRLSAAPALDGGRTTFDGAQSARADAPAVFAAAAADGPRLARPVDHSPAPAPAVPLKQRVGETAELGAIALGFQLFTGLAFLVLGAHASFPALAGALWVLAGTEMVRQLGKLRGFVVGGWQASHDQKMRHDYGTGRLVDIRGHKYGEDRYDVWAPGRVSRRERFATDATAVLLGLPWIVSAGPRAVALYAVGAGAAFAARAVWRRYRPEPAPVDKAPDFEPDR